MSLDTLLEAAEFLESSSKGKSKDDSAIARVHHSATVQLERRRAFSECEPLERRRRPGGAGTRETHNKLEKNRRAHLKECFDVLKKEVPSLEDKKTSNLNILRSALKYIQTLKKRERDYEAERDLLTISNNSIEQRLGVLKKEMVVTQNVAKNESKEPNDEMPASPSEGADADKVRSVETHVAPVSVATQTTFTSGEESTAGLIEGESVQVEAVGVPPSKGLENGIKEEENVEEKVCVDDEDEEVDVEGEVTDDNIVDDDDDDGDEAVNTGNTGEEDGTQNGVDDSLVAGGENHNLAKGEGKVEASLSGKTSASSKRKAACNDDGNKLDTKKSNIQCCARVSC